MIALTYAAKTDRGLVRGENQDAWFAEPESGIYGVTDGMGGHRAGGVASRIVAEALPKLLSKQLGQQSDLRDPDVVDRIKNVFADLSLHVREESQKEPGFRGMGATVTVAIIREYSLLVVHLGDSRAYLQRDTALQQITRDHSVARLLVEAGEITDSEATMHPASSRVTRYIGMEGETLPEAQAVVELVPTDRVLLCTDGLSGKVADKRVAEILLNQNDAVEACSALVEAANNAGGEDNVTALVIDCLKNAKQET